MKLRCNAGEMPPAPRLQAQLRQNFNSIRVKLRVVCTARRSRRAAQGIFGLNHTHKMTSRGCHQLAHVRLLHMGSETTGRQRRCQVN